MRRRILYNAVPRIFLLLVLILLVTYHLWPKHSSGFRVRIAPNTCNCPDGRIGVLRVSANGELSFNSEPLGTGALNHRLTDMYGTQYAGVVYFLGDENASYQNVIDAIAAVPYIKRTPPPQYFPIPEALRTPTPDMPNIEIQLVTPGAVESPCPEDCYNWGKLGLLHLP